MISSDLFVSLAACLRLSPRRYFDRVFLGFALYAAEPGFGPHMLQSHCGRYFISCSNLLKRFRSNSAETWPSKVIPLIPALFMFT